MNAQDIQPAMPPSMLFHGTANRFVPSILAQGLLPGTRRHVTLAHDPHRAAVVGHRYGQAVVLTVHALRMHDQGFRFYRDADGNWLTAHVPACFIR
ncbi:RNA 2'-phosphotransferase [Cupriavidus plantarum]